MEYKPHHSVLISPKNREEFMEILSKPFPDVKIINYRN
ncbi:hypothetical protein [Metabacillus sp. Hm71]